MPIRVLPLFGALLVALAAAYPVYLWSLRREAECEAAFELAQFAQACDLARLRLSGGGEFWSARIMANRCAAAGR